MRTLAVLISVLISSATFVCAAEDVGAGQSIIRSQEEAFGRDDAAEAYTFASPGIKNLFPSPDIFMAMVRNGYAPVYRHRSFEFGTATMTDGKILQQAHIIDADGVAWEAVYTLEPQSDGSLKISACVLKKLVGV